MRCLVYIFLLPLLYDATEGLTIQSKQNVSRVRRLTQGVQNAKIDLTPTQTPKYCLTRDNQRGECVSYFLCDDNNTIIDDGADILDLRDSSKYCTHYLDVCCGLNDIEVQTPIAEVITTTPKQSLNTVQNKLNTFVIPSVDTFNSVNVPEKKANECGWSNIDISPFKPNNTSFRPTKVTSAFYGEYPFAVAVMLRGSTVWSPNNYLGGGVLIHHKVVVTVVHNIQKLSYDQVKCRAGEYDIQTLKEQYPHQERNVRKIVLHENYYRRSLYNDIAVLFLETEFTAAPNIGVACLASELPVEEDCYSMGWGHEAPQSIRDNTVKVLKKVPLPLVKPEKCQEMLRKNPSLGPFFVLHSSLMCAGGENEIDTCTGDGGSALACAVNTMGLEKRYVVVGLVAYGLGCGHVGVPGVYVNIPNLYSWVTEQLDRENIEKTFVV